MKKTRERKRKPGAAKDRALIPGCDDSGDPEKN